MRPDRPARPAWRDPFVAAMVALASVPLVVAVVRALIDGWIPLGDQALFEIRASDVLTAHHPLVGTGTTAGLTSAGGIPLNHPGPLMFDALALPVRLFGGRGVAVGVVIVNVAALAIGTVFAARKAGRAGATCAALAFVGLGWAAGSESLYDPFSPTAAMLPTFACLILAWCTIDVDGAALLWLLGVASFVVQLHNSYVLVLAPLVLLAVAIYVTRAWRRAAGGLRRTAFSAAGLLLVLWSQPFVEQLINGRDGNVARMVRAADVLGTSPGPRLGTQIAAATLTLPPWWGRSEFAGIQTFSPVPDLALATGSLALLIVALALASWWVWRARRDGTAGALLLTAVAATTIAWLAATRAPASPFLGIGSGQVRWLWPVSMLVWFALLLAAVRLLLPAQLLVRRSGVIAAVLLVGVAVAANVPRHTSLASQQQLADLRPVAVELIRGARDNVTVDRVLYRQAPAYDLYGPAVLAGLAEDGVEFSVDDPVLIRQFGDGRRWGGESVSELRVPVGMDAVDVQGGTDVVAFASALSDAELELLRTMTLDIARWLGDGTIRLSAEGQAAVDDGLAADWLSAVGQPSIDATTVSRSLVLADVIDGRLLDGDPTVSDTLERFAAMRRVVEDRTAAVIVTPPSRQQPAT